MKNKNSQPIWIKYNEHISIQGITTTIGSFYVSSTQCFIYRESLLNNIDGFDKSCIKIPSINPNLPIEVTKKINTIKAFQSYDKLPNDGKYAYLLLLKGSPTIASRSKHIFNHYIAGLFVRMFIDPETTNEDRIGIVKSLMEIKKLTSKFDRQICDFISSSIQKYLTSEDLSFIPQSFLNTSKIVLNNYINNSIDNFNNFNIKELTRLTLEAFECDSIFQDAFAQELDQNLKQIYQSTHLNKNQNKNSSYYSYDAILLLNQPRHIYFRILTSTWSNEATLFIKKLKIYYDKFYKENSKDFNDYTQLKKFNKGNCLGAQLFLPYSKQTTNNPVNFFIHSFDKIFSTEEYLFIKPKILFNNLLGFNTHISEIFRNNVGNLILKRLCELGILIYPNKIEHLTTLDKDFVLCKVPLEECFEIEKNTLKNIVTYIKTVIFILQEDGIYDGDTEKLANFIGYYITNDYQLKYCISIFWHSHKTTQYLKPHLEKELSVLPMKFRKEVLNNIKSFALINDELNYERIDQIERVLQCLGEDWKNFKKELEYRIQRKSNGLSMLQNKLFSNDNTTPKPREKTVITLDLKKNVEYKENQTSTQCSKKKLFSNDNTTPKPREKTIITLDLKKIALFEEQTKESQQILSDIFNNKYEDTTTSAIKNDNSISKILSIIMSKTIWERGELEELSARHNFILNSMLEQINDYSYEKINDIVIDDDNDKIYVNTEYKDQLL